MALNPAMVLPEPHFSICLQLAELKGYMVDLIDDSLSISASIHRISSSYKSLDILRHFVALSLPLLTLWKISVSVMASLRLF